MLRKRPWSAVVGDAGAAAAPAEEAEPQSFAGAVLALAPKVAYETAMAEAFVAADGVLKQVFGAAAWALPFGSIVQGVHLDGSDLDLCFDEDGNSATEEGAKPDNTRQVACLKRVLGGLQGQFRVIETRFWKHMKVPIIILGYRTSVGIEIETDLSVGTVFEGVEKGFTDRVIRRVLAQNPHILHMARLVKLWAKVEKLNKAYDGYLNSLGWTLLVLYFCLERGHFDPMLLHEEEPNEKGPSGDFSELPPPLHTAPEKGEEASEEQLQHVPLVEDMADFFEWLGSWEAWWPQEPPPIDVDSSASPSAGGAWGLSLVDGTIMEVPKPTKVWPDTCSFFIEDPGVRLAKGTSENVARSLKTGTWATTLQRCHAAAAALRDESEDPGVAWIVELLRGVAAEKAAKAAPPQPRFATPAAARLAARQAPGFKGGAGAGGGAVWRPASWQPSVDSMAPPAKRARAGGGGICKWFLQGECWSGDNCRSSHG